MNGLDNLWRNLQVKRKWYNGLDNLSIFCESFPLISFLSKQEFQKSERMLFSLYKEVALHGRDSFFYSALFLCFWIFLFPPLTSIYYTYASLPFWEFINTSLNLWICETSNNQTPRWMRFEGWVWMPTSCSSRQRSKWSNVNTSICHCGNRE